MPMTYSSLVSPKGTAGSIMNWINYSKLDTVTVVDEAQALIWGILRCREMISLFNFNTGVGVSYAPLPAGFLDPIGRIYCPSVNLSVAHKDSTFILNNRNFTESNGVLGTDPITTTSGSTLISINLPNHGFSTESAINIVGATSVGGITPNGTFSVVSMTDVNNFVVDTLSLQASSSATGGGSSIVYLCDNLVQAFANWWGIWDEAIRFDCAAVQDLNYQLQYFKSPPLLSITNQSNFLTNRYPQLMRTACVASAADFMKDDVEYQKGVARLQALVQQISIENDMQYRGMELDAETP